MKRFRLAVLSVGVVAAVILGQALLAQVPTFDVAEEVEARPLEQVRGRLDDVVALDVLLADVEQTYRRPVDAFDRRRERAAARCPPASTSTRAA